MAIFSKKQNTAKKTAVTATESSVSDYTGILRSPRITEKATAAAFASSYIFEVAPRATKRDIMMAVKQIYKVTPRKITIAQIPRKVVRSARTGKVGVKGGGKKAYVYLNTGETITIA